MNTAPLQGIKVIDFTEVQSGPSCTQMLAWLGADVIKIERPGKGDATRKELQFDPDCPSYYFLQLNSDKKSLTLDAKTPDGKAILTKLLETADVFIENLHPGAMDKLGFSWEEVHKLNPKCIYGTIKGFPISSKYKDLKAYEPVAQVTAGAASTTGWWQGPDNVPTQSGAALGDSNTGMHLLIGILSALLQREKTGEGCYVYQSMHNACLNLCRIKTRDQLTLDRLGYLTQFPQYPNEKFGNFVPRSGNQEGSGVLGWTYKCKGWETDPNAYVYVILQRDAKSFELACKALGFEDWLTNPDFNTADARDKHKQEIYKRIESFTINKTKFEVTELLSKAAVPVGPVLSTKEIMDDQSLYDGNTLVKINQGGKVGEFVTVGCPFTLSNYQPTYGPCPELGGNTTEVLKAYGYTDEQIAAFAANHTTTPMPKPAEK
ncbi:MULTISPECIES: formyl-CoA transferase [Duncaniella]|jgi:formyl-CoA transferase|uniref:formyl-CoA transferase n=2 Tax=Muribaculaceae TaxID=2005473 RepID=UPI000AE71387|nr:MULTISPECIES: formyl-CoA transferase [Duncaniella]MBJ2189256.1 formyl-CoA transferase [Muribaculaceae bacterium]MCX4284542.1 formyl-CoA transferase [Duncaniella dubosii]ROS87952.1 formyl-CoA transferase [Muribaculaceae bacterium Isolate-080 (Janvier)]HBN63085.1 formyl-CoA transferase [Porphyromonadaceae bacterium]